MNTKVEAALNALKETTHEQFLALHAVLPTIQFDQTWNNGTGYMDGLVHDSTVRDGVWAFNTGGENNRNGIIARTGRVTIVMFERYTDGASGVLVTNVSQDAKALWNIINGSGAVTKPGMRTFMSTVSSINTIGDIVES